MTEENFRELCSRRFFMPFVLRDRDGAPVILFSNKNI